MKCGSIKQAVWKRICYVPGATAACGHFFHQLACWVCTTSKAQQPQDSQAQTKMWTAPARLSSAVEKQNDVNQLIKNELKTFSVPLFDCPCARLGQDPRRLGKYRVLDLGLALDRHVLHACVRKMAGDTLSTRSQFRAVRQRAQWWPASSVPKIKFAGSGMLLELDRAVSAQLY